MLTALILTIEHPAAPDRKELESLLARIAKQDQNALETLYHRTRGAVYAMALSVLKNAHDAQDVTQDTFVQVWDNASLYRPAGTPMAWLLTIARNLARMKLRQSSRHTSLEDEEWDAIPADTSAFSAEDRHLLQEALSVLTDQERQIVILHAVSGLKHREIAQLLELPLSTILSKYHRALQKLRLFMKGGDTL